MHTPCSSIKLWLGLLGAPLAWVAQMLLSETLSSHACYPQGIPLPAPVWTWLMPALAGISLLCILIAGVSSVTAWSDLRGSAIADKAHPRTDEERRRFVFMLSLIASFIFTTATIFTGGAVLLVDPCQKWW